MRSIATPSRTSSEPSATPSRATRNRRSDGQDVALQSRLAERTHDRPTDGFDEFRRAGDREVALVVREEPQPPPEMLERPESSTRVTANPLVSDVAGV